MTQQGAVVAFLTDCGGAVFDSSGSLIQRIAKATDIPVRRLPSVLAGLEDVGVISRDADGGQTYLVVLRGYGAEEPEDASESTIVEEKEPTPAELLDRERVEHRQVVGELRDRCHRLEQALEREQYNRKVGALQLAEAVERADRAEKNADIMQRALQRGYDPVRALISEGERRGLDRMVRSVPNR